MSNHYTNYVENDQINGGPMDNTIQSTPMDGIWTPDMSGGGVDGSGEEPMDIGGDAYRYWDHISVHNESTESVDGMDVWNQATPILVPVAIPVVQCELLEAVPNDIDPDMPHLESISDSGSDEPDESNMSVNDIALTERSQPRTGAYGFAAAIAHHQSRSGTRPFATDEPEVPPPPTTTPPPTLLGPHQDPISADLEIGTAIYNLRFKFFQAWVTELITDDDFYQKVDEVVDMCHSRFRMGSIEKFRKFTMLYNLDFITEDQYEMAKTEFMDT
jgi:hypothetical protein